MSAICQDTMSHTIPGFSSRIDIGWGTLTTDYLLDGYRPGRPTEFSYSNKNRSGAPSVTYSYHLTQRTYISAAAAIEQESGDWLDNEIPGGNVFALQTSTKGQFVRTAYTIALEVSYDYVQTEFFRLYTTVGLGSTLAHETDQYYPEYYNQGYYNGVNSYGAMRQVTNADHLNFYYSPFGMSVGKRMCIFMEAGFGYKGIFHTGLSYNFGGK